MQEKVSVLRGALSGKMMPTTDPQAKPGIYYWWFKEDCAMKLLTPLCSPNLSNGVNFSCIKKAKKDPNSNDNYWLLYVGIATTSIRQRFKWHIIPSVKHSVNDITRVSTLRTSISALNGLKVRASEGKVNNFIDENCILEWDYKLGYSKDQLEAQEKAIMNKGFFPLNIQGNNNVDNNILSKLKQLRKIARI